jgi:Asp-tRNA(Asn)/Glu-tRNA(Gln) amidotransferase A subunit family amidase
LSQPLKDLLSEGERISHDDYRAARRRRAGGLAAIDELFGKADFLLAPSALDEAPKFEDGTGDPAMSRAWTILGLPSISIPCGHGNNGLPLGLQIAARPDEDAGLLTAAAWFERCLNSHA